LRHLECVLRRAGKFLVVLTLVLSTGLHWAALQSVAWAGMLAGHLRSQSVAQAVSQTFDGKHLCPLCRAIAAAKNKQKAAESAALNLKFEYPPATVAVVLYPPHRFTVRPSTDLIACLRTDAPPAPPPRNLSA
jgi:hypothetical protein